MRIGLLAYPMLFQRERAYQLQVRDSIRALGAVRAHRGVAIRIDPLDPHCTAFDEYDLIHVFCASGANYRLLAAASAAGVPVLLSPLLAPPCAGGATPASYLATRHALQLARNVIVLGQHEKASVLHDFSIDAAKIRLLAPGITPSLFQADGELFRQRTGVHGPFVLMAGPIGPAHGQREVAQALAALALPLVLLGETRERDASYLSQVRAVGKVICLDSLKHDPIMLASAYAAAAVVVLPGQGDAGVRIAFEVLATGTPVVVTAGATLPLAPCAFACRQLAPDSGRQAAAQAAAMLALLVCAPRREAVRTLVRPFTWERAALQMVDWYLAQMASTEAA